MSTHTWARARACTTRTLALVLVALVLVQPLALAPVAAAPGGMVAVADANVADAGPAGMSLPVDVARFRGGAVMTSKHADTLEVTVTKSQYVDDVAGVDAATVGGDGMAVVLSDSINHDGREVAIDAGVLRDAIGYVPSVVYGTHESGREWTREVSVEDGYAVFRVSEFSSNVVTFTGGVSISGTATRSSTVSYSLTDLDTVDNFSVQWTGNTVTGENETASLDTYHNSTFGVDIAGNAEPTGWGSRSEPELVLQASKEESGNTTDAVSETRKIRVAGESGGNAIASEIFVEDLRSRATAIRFMVNDSAYQMTVDVRVATQEKPDGDITDGELVTNDHVISTSGPVVEIPLNDPVEGPPGAAGNATVQIITESYNGGAGNGYLDIETIDATGVADSLFYDDSIKTGTAAYSSPTTHQRAAEQQSISTPTSATVSFSSSGTSKTFSWTSGTQSTSYNVDLSVFDDSADLNISQDGGGYWQADVEYAERQQTVDPSITVNGDSDGFVGTLSDGSSTSLSLPNSWLQSDNSITVEAAAQSGDAPTPSVDYAISHDASSNVETTYQGTSWVERYNISYTTSTDRDALNLTIPFKRTAVALEDIDERTGGSGAWSDVPASDYSLNETHLVIHFGDVAAGTTVEARANATTVVARSGNISVTEPTAPGKPLSTTFTVDDVDGTAGVDIEVNRSAMPNRTHQTVSESWTAQETFLVEHSNRGGTLELPNAGIGDTATVETYPVRVEPQSGAVRVSEFGSSATEPSFQVKPAGTSGETVEYTFVEASSDTRYQLYSQTYDRERDSALASSPVTLVDDDSDETLVIRQADSDGGGSAGGGGGGDSGGGGVLPGSDGERPGTFGGLLVVGLSLAMIVLIWVGGARVGLGRDIRLGLAGLAVFYSVQLLNPSTLPSLLESINPIIPIVVIGVMVLLWRRFQPTSVQIVADQGGENL
jgi:hypothetical protein